MKNTLFNTMNPSAYENKIEAFERETQTQTNNYQIATENLIAANICYNTGLYNDSCNASSRAIEKFIKSCPDVDSITEHRLDSLMTQFSAITGYSFDASDKTLVKNNFYQRQYGDNYIPATKDEALRGLQLACDVKQETDIYRQTPIKDVLQFTGENKPAAPVSDDYIRGHQFDGMRTHCNTFTANKKS